MNELISLINRFQKLSDITGRSKSSSYQVILDFSPYDDQVFVELGGYDVGNWNRHTTFTTTKSRLIEELTNKIIEAERIVLNER